MDRRVLMDRDRVPATIRARDGDQLISTGGLGKSFQLIAGLEAAAIGNDPDLEQVDSLVGAGIELAVPDAGPGAHPLDDARFDTGAVAEIILVPEPTRKDISHDLHVL